MSEKDLNIEYICEKTLLNKDDELVPIILSLIQESYKAGLCQTEFDNTMNLIEENQELKKQLEDISEELELVRCDLHNRTSERDGYERELNECLSQQKEFIKFLEDNYKETQDIRFIKILQKHKEIIGVSDEKEN